MDLEAPVRWKKIDMQKRNNFNIWQFRYLLDQTKKASLQSFPELRLVETNHFFNRSVNSGQPFGLPW